MYSCTVLGMTSDPSNPHDALVRKLLPNAVDAGSEVRVVAPKAIAERLDWDEFELVDGSLVSAELRSRYTDRLFRTRTKFSGRPTFVYLLLEHQSTPDWLMAFRVLEYQVGVIGKYLRDKSDEKVERIPAVLSLVVHVGPKGVRWNAPLEVGELYDLDSDDRIAMQDYLPGTRYMLDDVNALDVPTLLSRPVTVMVRLVQVVVKVTGRGREALLATLPYLVSDLRVVLEGPYGREAFEVIATYIEYVGKLYPGEFETFAEQAQLGPIAKEVIVTTAEMREALGEARGEARGRAAMLVRQLTVKFGSLSSSVEEKVYAADVEQLDVWAEKVLSATSVEEALA